MIERIFNLDGADATQVIALGTHFFQQTGLKTTFKGPTFIQFWNGFLDRGVGTMWVYRENGLIVGTIGMTLTMCLMDGRVVADEMFWFVDPHYRGTAGTRLFFNMIEWAKKSGAGRITMGKMLAIDPENEKLQRFYERQGFKPLQMQYYMDL